MDYLEETKFAAEGIINLITYEHDKLNCLQKEFTNIKAKLQHLSGVSNFLRLNPDLDDEGIGTAAYWEAYFDVEPKYEKKASQVKELESRIETRRTARAALCGSLLQIAKQGISWMHGGCTGPVGRLIGSQNLRDVVWQARNQSIHFEEKNCKEKVVRCFNSLAEDFREPELRKFNSRNLATEVVELLKWTSYKKYEYDMRQLLSAKEN